MLCHVTDGKFLCGCFMEQQEVMMSDSRALATKMVTEKTEREEILKDGRLPSCSVHQTQCFHWCGAVCYPELPAEAENQVKDEGKEIFVTPTLRCMNSPF